MHEACAGHVRECWGGKVTKEALGTGPAGEEVGGPHMRCVLFFKGNYFSQAADGHPSATRPRTRGHFSRGSLGQAPNTLSDRDPAEDKPHRHSRVRADAPHTGTRPSQGGGSR